MPTPRENEPRDQFINRCIPVVMNDGTAQTPEQAYAICQNIYETSKKLNLKSNDKNGNTNGIR